MYTWIASVRNKRNCYTDATLITVLVGNWRATAILETIEQFIEYLWPFISKRGFRISFPVPVCFIVGVNQPSKMFSEAGNVLL